MAKTCLQWLWTTDAGLLTRIAIGASIFVFLAIWEIHRKGAAAKRWKEYLFLMTAVAAAMAYGAINDQVTVTISWEYFFYAKGLFERFAGQLPSSAGLRWEASKIGLKATWTAGLIFGVALLLANNPRRDTPQLPYRRLYGMIVRAVCLAAVCGAVLGLAGYSGAFAGFFDDILDANLWRPGRFMAVWGEHLGGYLGGLLATAWAIVQILRQRRTLKNAHAAANVPRPGASGHGDQLEGVQDAT